MTIFWKIYFWLLFATLFQAFFAPVNTHLILNVINLITFSIATMGFWGFAWNKKVFTQMFWKTFFVVSIFWGIFSTIFFPISQEEILSTGMPIVMFLLVGTLAIIPLYTALFLYAFKVRHIWDTEASTDSKLEEQYEE